MSLVIKVDNPDGYNQIVQYSHYFYGNQEEFDMAVAIAEFLKVGERWANPLAPYEWHFYRETDKDKSNPLVRALVELGMLDPDITEEQVDEIAQYDEKPLMVTFNHKGVDVYYRLSHGDKKLYCIPIPRRGIPPNHLGVSYKQKGDTYVRIYDERVKRHTGGCA